MSWIKEEGDLKEKTKNNNMTRLLLTGGAGFVGSHVLKYFLKNTDWEIVALIRLNHAGDANRIKDTQGNERVTYVYHDLKYTINADLREQIGEVDYILNLAANSHVDRSITNPKEFFEDNVLGAVNMLEYLRLHMPKARYLNFNTDEVYGAAPEGYKYKETDRFSPSNPYSASKACQTMAAISYFKTYGLDIINTYTMNIFGPDQNKEKLIPKAIYNAKKRIPMPVFAQLEGDTLVGVGTRHWLHVDNVGDALLFVLQNGVSGEAYNIVGTDELTNEEVVKAVNELLGTEPLIQYVDFHKTRKGHDRRYAIDGTKLAELGWIPKKGFKEGLKEVIDANR